ncbi:MAG: prephenate dehydratase [Candidatus Dormibacteria bacterium]
MPAVGPDPAGSNRVGYQGEPGAYSDEAAHALFPQARTEGFASFATTFAALDSGQVEVGVLPAENSLAGAVQEVSDLLWRHRSLRVSGEHLARIEHLLLGRLEAGRVRRALSHPQALAQCAAWLEERAITPVPVSDTALAARQVAAEGRPGDAAIASAAAAARYRLEVLARDIADRAFNQTRFLVVRRGAAAAEGLSGPAKLALGLTAAHRPGGLLAVLEVFARQGANLTRLDSRPIPDSPFHYRFYADGELDRGEDLVGLLEQLRAVTGELVLFGAYPLGSAA